MMQRSGPKCLRRESLAGTARLAIAALAIGAPYAAGAQIWPPEFKAINEQHINIMTASDFNLPRATLDITEPLLSIGTFDGELKYSRYFTKAGEWHDNFFYSMDASDISNIPVLLGDEMHIFSGMYPYTTIAGVNYDGDGQGNALTTTYVGGVPYWQYISREGMTALFDANINRATLVQFPTGVTRTYYYRNMPNTTYPTARLQSIVQNDGTMIKYTYDSDDTSAGAAWFHVASVSLVNMAYSYCDPAADHCSFSTSQWPSASFSGPASGYAPSGQTAIETTTTSTGYGRSYKKDSYGRILAVSNLHNYFEDLSYSYDGTSWGVTQVVNGRGDVRSYPVTWNSSPNSYTAVASSSYLGASETYYFDMITAQGMPTRVTDRSGRVRQYTWSMPDKHLLTVVQPEGNSESFQYDSRFNIIAKTRSPKPGSGAPTLTEQSLYDTACSNINTCNSPNAYIDARGAQRDFTYTSFGRKASEMQPPPTAGAGRPLKLYTYIQKSAYVLNAAGALVSTSQPIWLLSTETVCQTSPGSNSPVCDPNAVRTDTTYIYGADGTADSLLVKGKSVASGGVTLLTCNSYDRLRHKISETAPNAGLQVCP